MLWLSQHDAPLLPLSCQAQAQPPPCPAMGCCCCCRCFPSTAKHRNSSLIPLVLSVTLTAPGLGSGDLAWAGLWCWSCANPQPVQGPGTLSTGVPLGNRGSRLTPAQLHETPTRGTEIGPGAPTKLFVHGKIISVSWLTHGVPIVGEYSLSEISI